ncbi:MAG: FAD-dependent oxidoreductase [Actinomycetota bacterium]
MATVTIVGDGPGGLSAALFLAKNGHDVVVYGQDKTAVNFAYLYNYLGIPEISGVDFQKTARSQVEAYGARIVDAEVDAVVADGGRIEVQAGGERRESDYLILTEGKAPSLARSLGLDEDGEGRIVVDAEMRSSRDRVYVVGRSIRPGRSQAIISAGDGARAALDILAAEEGKDVQDWDTPPKD